MRLFLLPVSTRRTLIYSQRLNVTTTEQQTYLDKGTARAAKLWADWEKKESGWQKKVVDYGNQALKRIPYEEWGLKSIPPLSARKNEEEISGKGKVEVSFPTTLIPEGDIPRVLKQLATERQSLHKKRLIWSIVGMPMVAPFALVPMQVPRLWTHDLLLVANTRFSIPNLPFFYLVFRAWSHWRALKGSQHLEFLLDNKLIAAKPSKILDELYPTGKNAFKTESVPTSGETSSSAKDEERMLLHKADGKRIAEALEIPELNVELDRAVWQIEKALNAEKELQDEKKELDRASAEPAGKK